VVAHPVLLVATKVYSAHIFLPGVDTPWPVWVGTCALVAACLVVGLSVFRQRLRIGYEIWQITHGAFSIALIALATLHIYSVGRFSEHPTMRVLWAVYLVAFVGMFLRYRIVRPMQLLKRPWVVVENRAELGNARTMSLRPDGHPGFTFEPGQFGWIGFGRSPFSMSQHPISFSSNGDVPADDGLVAFTIKDLGDWSGEVVPAVEPGTRAWIDGPYGVFTIDREEGAGYVLIGGGVGITPLYSMIQALGTRGDVRPVYLFHGANDKSDLTFREEIAALAHDMPNLTVVTVLVKADNGWEGERGFIGADTLRRYLPERLFRRFQYFICGPAPLMDAMEEVLPEIGIPADRIHTERFDMV
jgi:predicted ferric reductase